MGWAGARGLPEEAAVPAASGKAIVTYHLGLWGLAVSDPIVLEHSRASPADSDVGKGGSHGDIGSRVEAAPEGRARYLGCLWGPPATEESPAVGPDGAFNRRGPHRGWGTLSEEPEGPLRKEFFRPFRWAGRAGMSADEEAAEGPRRLRKLVRGFRGRWGGLTSVGAERRRQPAAAQGARVVAWTRSGRPRLVSWSDWRLFLNVDNVVMAVSRIFSPPPSLTQKDSIYLSGIWGDI